MARISSLFGACVAIVTLSATVLAQPCPDVQLVFARGTGEPPGLGICGTPLSQMLSAALPGMTVISTAVDYAANVAQTSAGPGATTMTQVVTQAAAACPNTMFVVGGYSQGASVTDIALGIPTPLGTGQTIPADLASRVAAVVVFGNPMRAVQNQAIDAASSPTYGAKAIDICAQGDPVCGNGVNAMAHLQYPWDGSVTMAANFAAAQVTAAAANAPQQAAPAQVQVGAAAGPAQAQAGVNAGAAQVQAAAGPAQAAAGVTPTGAQAQAAAGPAQAGAGINAAAPQASAAAGVGGLNVGAVANPTALAASAGPVGVNLPIPPAIQGVIPTALAQPQVAAAVPGAQAGAGVTPTGAQAQVAAGPAQAGAGVAAVAGTAPMARASVAAAAGPAQAGAGVTAVGGTAPKAQASAAAMAGPATANAGVVAAAGQPAMASAAAAIGGLGAGAAIGPNGLTANAGPIGITLPIPGQAAPQAAAPAAGAGAGAACLPPGAQCGGIAYFGPTCCQTGMCKVMSIATSVCL